MRGSANSQFFVVSCRLLRPILIPKTPFRPFWHLCERILALRRHFPETSQSSKAENFEIWLNNFRLSQKRQNSHLVSGGKAHSDY